MDGPGHSPLHLEPETMTTDIGLVRDLLGAQIRTPRDRKIRNAYQRMARDHRVFKRFARAVNKGEKVTYKDIDALEPALEYKKEDPTMRSDDRFRGVKDRLNEMLSASPDSAHKASLHSSQNLSALGEVHLDEMAKPASSKTAVDVQPHPMVAICEEKERLWHEDSPEGSKKAGYWQVGRSTQSQQGSLVPLNLKMKNCVLDEDEGERGERMRTEELSQGYGECGV